MFDERKVWLLALKTSPELSTSAVEEEAKRHISRSAPVTLNRLLRKLGIKPTPFIGLNALDIFLDGVTGSSILHTPTVIVKASLVRLVSAIICQVSWWAVPRKMEVRKQVSQDLSGEVA